MSRARFEELLDDWAKDNLSATDRHAFEELMESNKDWKQEAEDHKKILTALRSNHQNIKAPAGLLSGAMQKARGLDPSLKKSSRPESVASTSPAFGQKTKGEPEIISLEDEQKKSSKIIPLMPYLLVASIAGVLVLSIALVYNTQSEFSEGQPKQLALTSDEILAPAMEEAPSVESHQLNFGSVGGVNQRLNDVMAAQEKRNDEIKEALEIPEEEEEPLSRFEQVALAEAEAAAAAAEETADAIDELNEETETVIAMAESDLIDDSDDTNKKMESAEEFQIAAGLDEEIDKGEGMMMDMAELSTSDIIETEYKDTDIGADADQAIIIASVPEKTELNKSTNSDSFPPPAAASTAPATPVAASRVASEPADEMRRQTERTRVVDLPNGQTVPNKLVVGRDKDNETESDIPEQKEDIVVSSAPNNPFGDSTAAGSSSPFDSSMSGVAGTAKPFSTPTSIEMIPSKSSDKIAEGMSERVLAYLSTQTREAGGFQLNGVLPGNARLAMENKIEIVGQAKQSSDASSSEFVAEFANESDFNTFLMRLKAIPVSVSRTTEVKNTSNTPMLPGVRALRSQAISRGEKPAFTESKVSQVNDFPLDEYAYEVAKDPATGKIKITIRKTNENGETLDKIVPGASSNIRRY